MMEDETLAAFRSLLDQCNEDLKKCQTEKEFLQRCQSKCETCLQDNPKVTGENLTDLLRGYAEAVLDYTYHDECQMVEEEFPEQSSRDRIHDIFGYFDNITSLVGKVCPGKEVMEVLGQELNECLQWRKGALLYMYCKTVEDSPDRRKATDTQQFKKDLQNGAEHLKQVLRVNISSASASDGGDTLNLVNMGIYSETTLLAMMYGGEMCYWHHLLVNQGHKSDSDNFDVVATGAQFLNLYIKAVQGPLAGFGWSTDRAQELLQYFSQHS